MKFRANGIRPAVEQQCAKGGRIDAAAAVAETCLVPAATRRQALVCMGTIEIESAPAGRNSHVKHHTPSVTHYLLPNGTSPQLDVADAAGATSVADNDDTDDNDDGGDDDADDDESCCQQSREVSGTICIRPGHLQA